MGNEICPSNTSRDDETNIERYSENQQFGYSENVWKRPVSASKVNPEIIEEATASTTINNKKIKRGFEKSFGSHQKEISKLTAQLQQKVQIIAEHEITIRQLEERNNETLTRLSAMASAKLTDGNANIADLSDENRPTKLSEKFSELYDNEWTNAFEFLTEIKKLDEETAILTLLKVLCVIYLDCKTKANEDYKSLVTGIQSFIVLKDQEIPKDFLKFAKDARKKNFKGELKNVRKKVKENIHKIFPDKTVRKTEAVKKYLETSLQLCWLMAVQDPPVHMDTVISKSDEPYDSNTHKQYTKSGTLIDYIVWPAIYLCENGSLLAKGIAQCKEDRTPILDEQRKQDKSFNGGIERNQNRAETVTTHL